MNGGFGQTERRGSYPGLEESFMDELWSHVHEEVSEGYADMALRVEWIGKRDVCEREPDLRIRFRAKYDLWLVSPHIPALLLPARIEEFADSPCRNPALTNRVLVGSMLHTSVSCSLAPPNLPRRMLMCSLPDNLLPDNSLPDSSLIDNSFLDV